MNKFKKFLPLILVIVGLGVVTAAYFMFKGGSDDVEEEKALIDVPLEERPVVSLTPTEDGHWLNLLIEKLVIKEAESVDYELLYKLPDGRTQGVPGTVKLKGLKKIERELLLGSESSGKFRYDEGVKEGTLTLRYRNAKGKLLAKFTTDFALLSDTNTLASIDGKFTANLDDAGKDYYVVMGTFGLPDAFSGSVTTGPYGVFSSSGEDMEGKVSPAMFRWMENKWSDTFAFATGIFVGSN